MSSNTQVLVDHDGHGTGRGLKPPASSDRSYRIVLWSVGAIMSAIIVLFVYSIIKQSIPGWQASGWSFFTSGTWNFTSGQYGARPLLLGTLFTTIGALILAVPIALGTAIGIVFLVPRRLKNVVSSIVELLAVVPSVIYGVWGVLIIAAWLGGKGEPWLQRLFHGNWPFSGEPLGFGMALGCLVLGVMILPTIAAISRDVIAEVPKDLQEGAYSLGATQSQVIRKVVVPTARTGIFGAIVLGTGRALGETVAMVFVLGGVTQASPYPKSLFSTGATLASEIANNFSESFGQPTLIGVLACLALVLMVLVGLVNLAARLIVARAERKLR